MYLIQIQSLESDMYYERTYSSDQDIVDLDCNVYLMDKNLRFGNRLFYLCCSYGWMSLTVCCVEYSMIHMEEDFPMVHLVLYQVHSMIHMEEDFLMEHLVLD